LFVNELQLKELIASNDLVNDPDLATHLTGASSEFIAFQQDLIVNGFSSEILGFLNDLGFDALQIEELKESVNNKLPIWR